MPDIDQADRPDASVLRELVAREQIRHTIAAYTHAGDSFQLEELAAQFTEDGVLRIRSAIPGHGGDEARGREEIVTMLRAQAWTDAPAGFFVRHSVSNVMIQNLSPTEAGAVSYFTVFSPAGPDHWGRYRDEFVPVGARWLIRNRLARVEGHGPDSWWERAFPPA